MRGLIYYPVRGESSEGEKSAGFLEGSAGQSGSGPSRTGHLQTPVCGFASPISARPQLRFATNIFFLSQASFRVDRLLFSRRCLPEIEYPIKGELLYLLFWALNKECS